MTETVQSITKYLEGYERTNSNTMDSKFGIFKVDVYSLAKDLDKGDLYIYSKEEYIESLNDMLKENIEYHIENGLTVEEANEEEIEILDKIKEVKESNCTVFIEKSGSEHYYSV